MERGPIVGPVPFRIFFPFSEEKKENEEEVSRSIANNTEICYFIRNGNRARRSVKESVGIQVCVSLVYTWPIGFRKFREKNPFHAGADLTPIFSPDFLGEKELRKERGCPRFVVNAPTARPIFSIPGYNSQ